MVQYSSLVRICRRMRVASVLVVCSAWFFFFSQGVNSSSGSSGLSNTDEIQNEQACGNKDVKSHRRKKRYAFLGRRAWRRFPLTVGFKNYTPKMAKSTQENIAMGCARKWASVSGLSFVLVRNRRANIYIEFLPLRGKTVGYAVSPNPPSSSIYLSSWKDWKPRYSSRRGGLSLEEALCHEMGHTLGLSHSTYRSAIMYHSVGFRRQDTELGQDDINGIQAIYGGPNGKAIGGKIPQVDSRDFGFNSGGSSCGFFGDCQTYRPRRPTRRYYTRRNRYTPYLQNPFGIVNNYLGGGGGGGGGGLISLVSDYLY